MDPYNRETSTNYPERIRAAKDILNIGRWHDTGVIYYENGVFALRIGNEGVILLQASNYKEAEYLAEEINHKLRIDLIRREYEGKVDNRKKCECCGNLFEIGATRYNDICPECAEVLREHNKRREEAHDD